MKYGQRLLFGFCYVVRPIQYKYIEFELLPSSNSTPNSISTSTQLDLHFKSIQLLPELSWSYALYLVCTTTTTTTTTHPPYCKRQQRACYAPRAHNNRSP